MFSSLVSSCRLILPLALVSFSLTVASAKAAFVDPNLSGTTSYDGWSSLTKTSYGSLAAAAFNPWSGSITANQTGSSGGQFIKVSGSGYAAVNSVYTPGLNAAGTAVDNLKFTGPAGVFKVSSSNPVADLDTVVFQTAIGAGPQTDTFVLPVLNYNGGSQGLSATSSLAPVTSSFVFPIPTTDDPNGPTENQEVTLTYRYYTWNVSAIANISSFDIVWTTGVHAQIYGLQLDQAAVPEPSAIVLSSLACACLGAFRRGCYRKTQQAT